jgi:hypothetical protein
MNTYEVFDPRDGVALLTVRSAIVASIVVSLARALGMRLDYALPGEGY